MDNEIIEYVDASGHNAVFYHDPAFWVALSFFLFLAAAARFIWPPIARMLDNRAYLIRSQLEQATRLREEAETLLAHYAQQQKDMAQEAEEILANARRDARLLREKAAEELTLSLARRSQQAQESIARAEAAAVAHIRTRMVDTAIATTRHTVAQQLKGEKTDPALERALQAIEQHIH